MSHHPLSVDAYNYVISQKDHNYNPQGGWKRPDLPAPVLGLFEYLWASGFHEAMQLTRYNLKIREGDIAIKDTPGYFDLSKRLEKILDRLEKVEEWMDKQ